MKCRMPQVDIDLYDKAMELAEQLDELTDEDLERELGIGSGTAYFYLQSMADCGLITELGLTGRYRLSERYRKA